MKCFARTASLVAAFLLVFVGAAASQTGREPPPVVQPGAPGEPTRELERTDLQGADLPRYTAADVEFVQRMIPHHAQALEMTALVNERTADRDLRRLALRIEISQRDEIELLTRWLRERGEALPIDSTRAAPNDSAAHRAEETGSGAPPMSGMLAPTEMARLEAARGERFDRLFLELMIRHHEGALRMVDDLFRSSGGQVPAVYHLASGIQADQQMEIRRIRSMLDALGAGPDQNGNDSRR